MAMETYFRLRLYAFVKRAATATTLCGVRYLRRVLQQILRMTSLVKAVAVAVAVATTQWQRRVALERHDVELGLKPERLEP